MLLVLRDSQLCHTEFIHGLVVYTGFESKVMLNYSRSVHKQSRVDHMVFVTGCLST